MTDRSQCQNCQQIWDNEQLHDIRDFHQRVAPGEKCPSGECPDPDCGAVCHPYTEPPVGFDVEDWKQEVENDSTVLGFKEWLEHKAEEQKFEKERGGAGMEIMTCDDCGNALEEGRIGLCDNCTPLPLVTPERLEDLACQCFNKSQDIDAGIYGTDEDNESWAANLRRAASRLRNCLNTLNGTDLEEIQCGTDATEDENEYLRSQSEAA